MADENKEKVGMQIQTEIVKKADIPAIKRVGTSELVKAYDNLKVGEAMVVTGNVGSVRSAVRYHKIHERLLGAKVCAREGKIYILKEEPKAKVEAKKKEK